MSSITLFFALLIVTITLVQWCDCKVLHLQRETYQSAYGAGGGRGYAPRRHRWFRSYGRNEGYGDGYGNGGYGNGGYEGDGYGGDGYGRDGYDRDGYDRNGYDHDGMDIHKKKNVKVNVKVYTAEGGRYQNNDE